MKKTQLLLAALLILSFNLRAQTIETSGKQNASVNYERLSFIDSIANHYIKNNRLTGLVTIIVKDNQLVQYKGYGYQDFESKKPMPANAIFRIMSQTKAITSVGIMMLYEKGKFTLDEPVSDFIPEFKNQTVLNKFNAADTTYTTVPAKREITFRDLLTHTSGIDYADIGSNEMRAIYAKAGVPSGLGEFKASLLDKMKILARLPLVHQPGEKFTYGLNSDLLGCLIEIMSGMNLEDYLRKNIFIPLGMNDTYFNLPKDKFSRLASVYTEDSLHHIIKWSHTFRNIDPDYPMMQKHYFSGGAGLSSTALDYAIFLQMMLNGGSYNGHELLAPRTVQLMTVNQIGNLDFGLNKLGLGFEITTAAGAAKGPRSEGSFAWGGYYGTTYWADPKEHMVCLIMTQQNPNSHGDITEKIQQAMYGSLKK
jgi:CubicO group peptidase (beta-lactamase class C family)